MLLSIGLMFKSCSISSLAAMCTYLRKPDFVCLKASRDMKSSSGGGGTVVVEARSRGRIRSSVASVVTVTGV